jgi:hypothetical protein
MDRSRGGFAKPNVVIDGDIGDATLSTLSIDGDIGDATFSSSGRRGA